MVTKNLVDNIIKDDFIASASIQERFPLYLYGRQTGQWKSMVFGKAIDNFKSQYVLGKHNINPNFPLHLLLITLGI